VPFASRSRSVGGLRDRDLFRLEHESTMTGMTNVFLSSTARGLARYRDAVAAAINKLDGFKCVRMEDFGARADVPLECCLKALLTCDIFVGLIGYSYGSSPTRSAKSYTEHEYDAARESGMPILMFIAGEDFPLYAADIEPDDIRAKQQAFQERIHKSVVRDVFVNEDQLAKAVVLAIHNQEVAGRESSSDRTVFLFSFVTNQAGFDTGVAISNTSDRPFDPVIPKSGSCVIYYYGNTTGGGAAPATQHVPVIPSGTQLSFVLSTGGTHGLVGTPGFQGYIIVDCAFPAARGFAFITDGPIGAAKLASGYLAEILETV
jgi:hypothetical protein